MASFLWTEKADTGPAGRFGHAMAFDSARNRTVLFGGDDLTSHLDDTWEWDGEQWTQLADTGPSPRSRLGLAFDSSAGRTLLFGGSGASGPRGDTWQWNGESWTQVADAGPSARSGHAMAYDYKRNRSVLFGGRAQDGLKLDTWEWDGTGWTQQQDIGPAPRADHALAFDAARGRCLLFGGDGGDSTLGDTWEWDGATWTQEADFGPKGRLGAAMSFKGDAVALFGGSDSVGSTAELFGDTWAWNGRHWTQRQDMGPAARWLHALAFDSARGHLVLFGGRTTAATTEPPVTGLSGQTWEHSDSDAAARIQVASVTAQPADLAVGGTTTVTVTSTNTAPPTTALQIGWDGPGLADLRAFGSPLDEFQQSGPTRYVELDASGQADFQLQLERFQNSVATSPGDVLARISAAVIGTPPQRVELHAL